MKLSRALLHALRIGDAVLFWPVLFYVIWGEVGTLQVPDYLEEANDKTLHFMAYFVLAAMAGAALKKRSAVIGAALALIALGGVLEIIQGFVGRDMSLYDELANTGGVIIGAVVGWLLVKALRERLGYW